MKKRLAILGSTGSIGTQTLEVIREHPGVAEVEILSAQNNASLLIKQAIEFKPNAVVIGNNAHYKAVSSALRNYPIKVFAGEEAIEQIVASESIDLVLSALVGYAGLKPTLAAIRAGKNIALANKETLVVAGDLIMEEAKRNKCFIIPVDSEHSAIFQCLTGEPYSSIEKIYLTASGGPFRGKSREHLHKVTKEEALKHPNWKMGDKITIDSASLMNKGLEVIEARWLFNLKPEQIEVILHPQSVIHSIVQFIDGSMKAQMGLPDMKLPILYALTFPMRTQSCFARFNFARYPELTFGLPDKELFRNLSLAYEALHRGGNVPCILNAANEVAVRAFLNDRINFLKMPEIIELCMSTIPFIKKPGLDDYVATHHETLIKAGEMITNIKNNKH